MKKEGDILYVDDNPDELLNGAKLKRARFQAYTPDTLKDAAKGASKANLWVFDYFTVEEERNAPSLDGTGRTGLGVFHQLRRTAPDGRPPSVLVSNHLDAAIGSFVPGRRHIAAEQLGIEWVAPKLDDATTEPISEIVALADAVVAIRSSNRSLAQVGSARYSTALSYGVLGLSKDVGWADAAVRDVDAWRPPVSATGRELVAWMLRQALPHPSFIVRAPHLAVRLGITAACLESALAQKTKLASLLRKTAYSGILATFAREKRWWSAGVDAIAFEIPRDAEARTAFLTRAVAPVALEQLSSDDWVVVSDSDLVETSDLVKIDECVRASDEYFPSQAPPAWVRIADAVQDRVLARKVRLEDQSELVLQP